MFQFEPKYESRLFYMTRKDFGSVSTVFNFIFLFWFTLKLIESSIQLPITSYKTYAKQISLAQVLDWNTLRHTNKCLFVDTNNILCAWLRVHIISWYRGHMSFCQLWPSKRPWSNWLLDLVQKHKMSRMLISIICEKIREWQEVVPELSLKNWKNWRFDPHWWSLRISIWKFAFGFGRVMCLIAFSTSIQKFNSIDWVFPEIFIIN